jgi:hypothetical protein
MPVVNVEPTDEYPVPFSTDEEKPDSFLEDMIIAANTAELKHELGAPLEIAADDVDREKALLLDAIKKKKVGAVTHQTTAYAAASFLRTYGSQLALDVASARSAITNKLMELANCGDPKFELKALELLGKHSDIGLFTERSEITINYKTPEALEEAIKERVKRLLNADIIDVTPLSMNLDEEFGLSPSPGEAEEPEEAEGEPEEEVEEDDNE